MVKIYDANMRGTDEVGMYLTVVEMTALTIIMIWVLYFAFKKKLYSFMKILILLCILADIGTGMLSVGLALETDPIYHKSHESFVAHLIGWNTFWFNWPTNLLHWMFGFKYWVISVEVPLVLGGKIENQRSREMWYMTLNVFMIVVNTFFCVWVSLARY
jgi:hypothetical protein